jgi:hypothetical protein
MEVLSHSRLSQFRTCPRKYAFEYIQGRVPIRKTRALEVGLAWHEAMEVYWRESREAAIQWLISQAEVLEQADTAKLVALLRHYAPPVDQYEVVSIEEAFEGPVRVPGRPRALRGYRFGGRRDMVLRDKAGHYWLLERKTTSDDITGFGDFWRRLNLDFQTSVYLLYGTFEGVLYDVVRKPQLRPSRVDEAMATSQGIPVADAYLERISREIAANPAVYFQFREIRKTPQDLAETAADLAQWTQNLRACHRSGHFPRNTGACRGLFGPCQYIDVCSGAASIDDDTLFQDKVMYE